MAIASDLTSKQITSIIESTATAGQPAQVVVNPDGSNVGAGGAVTSVIPGTGATNLGKAEDAVHASGDTGVMALAVANEAQTSISSADGDYTPVGVNRKGTVYVQEVGAPAYEDNTIGVAKVEQRFSYTKVSADTQIKASAGFVHSLIFAATGAVTAGVITLYDNTAESGTVIWTGTIQTGLNPTTIMLNTTAATGIYVGYDGTIANVSTTVTWR